MSEKGDGQRLEEIQRWTRAAEEEIREITAAIAPLEVRLKVARERLDLLKRLGRLGDLEGQARLSRDTARPGEPQVPDETTGPYTPGQELEGHIELILREAGRPMHISEIRNALVDRAVPLPGRGDEANIIVRLRRAPERFTRTGRGQYALAALGLPPVPVGKRRRRVRRSA